MLFLSDKGQGRAYETHPVSQDIGSKKNLVEIKMYTLEKKKLCTGPLPTHAPEAHTATRSMRREQVHQRPMRQQPTRLAAHEPAPSSRAAS